MSLLKLGVKQSKPEPVGCQKRLLFALLSSRGIWAIACGLSFLGSGRCPVWAERSPRELLSLVMKPTPAPTREPPEGTPAERFRETAPVAAARATPTAAEETPPPSSEPERQPLPTMEFGSELAESEPPENLEEPKAEEP